MDHDLNIKSKPIKLLEKNREENFYDLMLGKEFLDMTAKNTIAKRKKMTNQISSKFKTFVLQKTLMRMKRLAVKLEETFANHISDNGLVSRI